MTKITNKQARFVDEYLIDLNATQAAIRAGYTPKTADRMGYKILGYSWVSKAVEEAKKERSKRTKLTADAVVKELAKLGFSNIKNIFNKEGNLIPIHELPNDVVAAISEITVVNKGHGDSSVIEIKYKMHDKKGSLKLLGDHLRIFDKKEESNSDTLNNNISKLIDKLPN